MKKKTIKKYQGEKNSQVLTRPKEGSSEAKMDSVAAQKGFIINMTPSGQKVYTFPKKSKNGGTMKMGGTKKKMMAAPKKKTAAKKK